MPRKKGSKTHEVAPQSSKDKNLQNPTSSQKEMLKSPEIITQRAGIGGRPTKDNPDKRAIILEAIQRDRMPRYLAAAKARIHRDTLSSWIDKDPEFLAQIEEAEANRAANLLNTICSDSNGAWKVLKNLEPQHFKDEVAVQQTNNYAIMLSSPDGSKQSLSFGIQAPSIPARSDLLQEENTSGDKRDTGGEVLSRSIMAANKDSNGSSGS